MSERRGCNRAIDVGPVRAKQGQGRRAILCWVTDWVIIFACVPACGHWVVHSTGLGSAGKTGLAAVMGCQGNDSRTDAPQGFSLWAPPSAAAVLEEYSLAGPYPLSAC